MKNFWTIFIIILAIIVGLRLIGILFSISFALVKILFPFALIGFAIYGLSQFLKKR